MLPENVSEATRTIATHKNLNWVAGSVAIHQQAPDGEEISLPYDLPQESLSLEEIRQALELLGEKRPEDITHEMLAYCAERGFLEFVTPHGYQELESRANSQKALGGSFAAREHEQHELIAELAETQVELARLAEKERPPRIWEILHSGHLNEIETQQKADLKTAEISLSASVQHAEAAVKEARAAAQEAVTLRTFLQEFGSIDHGFVRLSLRGQRVLEDIQTSEKNINRLHEEIADLEKSIHSVEEKITAGEEYFQSWRSSSWVSTNGSRVHRLNDLEQARSDKQTFEEQIENCHQSIASIQLFDRDPGSWRTVRAPAKSTPITTIEPESATLNTAIFAAELVNQTDHITTLPGDSISTEDPTTKPVGQAQNETELALDAVVDKLIATGDLERAAAGLLNRETGLGPAIARPLATRVLNAHIEADSLSEAVSFVDSMLYLFEGSGNHVKEFVKPLATALSLSDVEELNTLFDNCRDSLDYEFQGFVCEVVQTAIDRGELEDAVSIFCGQSNYLMFTFVDETGRALVTALVAEEELTATRHVIENITDHYHSQAYRFQTLVRDYTHKLAKNDAADADSFFDSYREQLDTYHDGLVCEVVQAAIDRGERDEAVIIFNGQANHLMLPFVDETGRALIAALVAEDELPAARSVIDAVAETYQPQPWKFRTLVQDYVQQLAEYDASEADSFFDSYNEQLDEHHAGLVCDVVQAAIDRGEHDDAATIFTGQSDRLLFGHIDETGRALVVAMLAEDDLSAARSVIDAVAETYPSQPWKFRALVQDYARQLAEYDASEADSFFDSYREQLDTYHDGLVCEVVQAAIDRGERDEAVIIFKGQANHLMLPFVDETGRALIAALVAEDELPAARSVIDAVAETYQSQPWKFRALVQDYARQLAEYDASEADSFFDSYNEQLDEHHAGLVCDVVQAAIDRGEHDDAATIFTGQSDRLLIGHIDETGRALVVAMLAEDDLSAARDVIDAVAETYQPQPWKFRTLVQDYVQQLAANDASEADSFLGAYSERLDEYHAGLVYDVIQATIDRGERDVAAELLEGQHSHIPHRALTELAGNLIAAQVVEDELDQARAVIDFIKDRIPSGPGFDKITQPYRSAVNDSDLL